jgi:outer membrane lipoprotein SlyB
MRLHFAALFLVPAVLLTGCMSSPSSRPATVIRGTQVGKMQTLEHGTVTRVEACVLEPDMGPNYSIGASAGRSAGGAIGMGAPAGTVLAGTAGAVIGSTVGKSVEKYIRTKPGQLIEVVLSDGRTIVVAQENNPPLIGGERVKVLISGDEAKVLLDESDSRPM